MGGILVFRLFLDQANLYYGLYQFTKKEWFYRSQNAYQYFTRTLPSFSADLLVQLSLVSAELESSRRQKDGQRLSNFQKQAFPFLTPWNPLHNCSSKTTTLLDIQLCLHKSSEMPFLRNCPLVPDSYNRPCQQNRV